MSIISNKDIDSEEKKYLELVSQKSKKRKRESSGIIVKDIFKKTKRESLKKDKRFEILQQQMYKCNMCLNPFGTLSFDVDHIIPLEQGGTNDIDNLQALCESCHIFKTSILDRGVIARLLQAKIQNKKNGDSSRISRKEILEECQMIYFNRNRKKVPFHQNEMLNFCIDTVDLYREMCKKEVKKRVDDIMKIKNISNELDTQINKSIISEDSIKISSKPSDIIVKPTIKQTTSDNKKYISDLVSIIESCINLNSQWTTIQMNNFFITVCINIKNKKVILNLYEELNIFFKEIYDNKLTKLEKDIECIKITFEKF